MIDNFIIFLIGVQIFFRASFFSFNLLPTMDVAGASSFGFHDLSFFLLFVLSFTKVISKQENSILKSWASIFLGLFMVVGLFGVVNATIGETGFHRAARESREFFLYTLFFIVLTLSPKEQNIRRIVSLVMFFAVVTSVFSILQIFVGDRIGFLSGKIQTLNTLNQEVKGITRVGSGGLSTINFAFFICFSSILKKVTKKNVLFFVLLLMGIFFSFNRGTWFSIILALIIIFPFLNMKLKKKFFFLAMSFCLLGIIFVTAGSVGMLGGKAKDYLVAGIDRFTTIEPEKITKDGSTLGRLEEAQMIFKKFLERPFMGHGLGAVTQKGVFIKEGGGVRRLDEWGYVHNGYLYILFKLGLSGLFIFLVFLIGFSLTAIKGLKYSRDSSFEHIYMGSLLFFLSIIPHSVVSPRIMEGKYIVIISLSIGLIELIRQNLKKYGKLS